MPTKTKITPEAALTRLDITLDDITYLSPAKINAAINRDLPFKYESKPSELNNPIYKEAQEVLLQNYILMNFNKALSALGFDKDAVPTAKDMTKAYRKEALKNHPDKSGGDETKFKILHEAYDQLTQLYELIDVQYDTSDQSLLNQFARLFDQPTQYFLASMMLRQQTNLFVNEQSPEPFACRVIALMNALPSDELENILQELSEKDQFTKFSGDNLESFLIHLSQGLNSISELHKPSPDKLWSLLKSLPTSMQSQLLSSNVYSVMKNELLKYALQEIDTSLDPTLFNSLTPSETKKVHKLILNASYEDIPALLKLLSGNTKDVIKQISSMPQAFLWAVNKDMVHFWGNMVKSYINLHPGLSDESRDLQLTLFQHLDYAKDFKEFQQALGQYYQVIKNNKTELFVTEADQFKSLMEILSPKAIYERSTLKQVENLSPDKLSDKKDEIEAIISHLVHKKAEQDKSTELRTQLQKELASSELVKQYTPEQKVALAQFVIEQISTDLEKATRIIGFIQQNNTAALQQEEGWPASLTSTKENEFDDIIQKYRERAQSASTESISSTSSFSTLKMRNAEIVQRHMKLYFTTPNKEDAPTQYLVFNKTNQKLAYHNGESSIAVRIKDFEPTHALIDGWKETQAELEGKNDKDKVVSIHLDSEQLEALLDLSNLREELNINNDHGHRLS